jgi:hypothetical protein
MTCESPAGFRTPAWASGPAFKLRFGPHFRAEMGERGVVRFGSLLPFSRHSQLLVCETDGFSLSGAVLARAGNRIEVLHRAHIAQVEMAEAVADLVGLLQADGWKGGGPAVLLSPAVLSTLVELPVNPKKPRPVPQMLELVRWEAEPLLMQQMTRWSIGQLLAARGYMTEEQVRAVIDLVHGKPNPAGGLQILDTFTARRFGDLAEELGYVKRSQLNACLTAQQWLKTDDERIECGWTAQGPVEDVPGTFNWLVSCVGTSLLQRWTDVFARHKLKLKAMYPLAGCGAGLLPKSQAAGLVLEAHSGLAFAARVEAGQIVRQQYCLAPARSTFERCLESYHALGAAPHEPVWVACWEGNTQALAADLRQMLAIEVNALTDPALAGPVTPGMLGAARHAFGIGVEGRCVAVREGGPLPPLPQRLEVRAAALLMLLLVAIAVAEISLSVRKDRIDARKAEVDAQWKTVDEASKRIKAQIAQIEQRKQALAEQKADQARLGAMLDFYNRAIPERVALVQSVLGVLQNTVGDEVIMIGIDEDEKNTKVMAAVPAVPAAMKDARVEVENFNLEAWAISEAAGQSFIQKMKEAVASWQLEVRNAQVASRPGPLNLEGFAVSMRLVKLAEADGAAAGEAKVGTR